MVTMMMSYMPSWIPAAITIDVRIEPRIVPHAAIPAPPPIINIMMMIMGIVGIMPPTIMASHHIVTIIPVG